MDSRWAGRLRDEMSKKKQSLFDEIGGLPMLQEVHCRFYDKVYEHDWLGKFFAGHARQSIENRQTRFMAEKMGGPVEYYGKKPLLAHRHMYITEELFNVRQTLLRAALIEAGIPEQQRRRWLKIDNAFRSVIVKPSIAAFYSSTWRYEKRIIIPPPVR